MPRSPGLHGVRGGSTASEAEPVTASGTTTSVSGASRATSPITSRRRPADTVVSSGSSTGAASGSATRTQHVHRARRVDADHSAARLDAHGRPLVPRDDAAEVRREVRDLVLGQAQRRHGGHLVRKPDRPRTVRGGPRRESIERRGPARSRWSTSTMHRAARRRRRRRPSGSRISCASVYDVRPTALDQVSTATGSAPQVERPQVGRSRCRDHDRVHLGVPRAPPRHIVLQRRRAPPAGSRRRRRC